MRKLKMRLCALCTVVYAVIAPLIFYLPGLSTRVEQTYGGFYMCSDKDWSQPCFNWRFKEGQCCTCRPRNVVPHYERLTSSQDNLKTDVALAGKGTRAAIVQSAGLDPGFTCSLFT